MALSLDPGVEPDLLSSDGFEIYTRRCDLTRAELHVAGVLDDDAADLLRHVIDGHLRARRRFLRLDVGDLRRLADSALAVIVDAHERLLAGRGTLVLTAVPPGLVSRLRAAGTTSPLLLLPESAAERGGFGLA